MLAEETIEKHNLLVNCKYKKTKQRDTENPKESMIYNSTLQNDAKEKYKVELRGAAKTYLSLSQSI